MRLRVLVALLGLLVVGLAAPHVSPAASAATVAQPTGPDVARYQHPNGAAIDWPAVRRSGQSFAFVKGTQGTTYTNEWFASDWKGIAAAGMYRGAYHYANPGVSTAKAQADYFADAIGSQRIPGTLPPVLDLEDAGNLSVAALQAWTQAFLDQVEARTGRVPMIYTYPYFWQTKMGGSTAFTRYPLWIAHYTTNGAQPNTLGWPRYTFWQYTSTGPMAGISSGNVDKNRFGGTSLDLAALALAGTWGPPTSTAADQAQSPATSAQSRYVGMVPQRVADTRSAGQPVSGDLTVTLPDSVPADSTGVVLDVSAAEATGPGYLRAAPTGTTATTTALNYGTGRSTTGLVVTQASVDRQVTLTTYGTAVDLVVDLVGYYTAAPGVGGHWTPVTPSRVADTRTGAGGVPVGKATGSVEITLPGTVPATAAGVVLDLSATQPGGLGFLRVAPSGEAATTTALNFDRSGSSTGLAITRAAAGKVTVTVNGAATDLVVDLVGWYEGESDTGSGYVPVTPQRFLDTRTGLGASGPGTGPLSLTVPASIPGDATAVILDVSVVDPDGEGFVRLAAPGTEATTTAVNTTRGRQETGLVITGIRDGQITLAAYAATTHLVIDVVGYQAAPAAAPAPTATPTP